MLYPNRAGVSEVDFFNGVMLKVRSQVPGKPIAEEGVKLSTSFGLICVRFSIGGLRIVGKK